MKTVFNFIIKFLVAGIFMNFGFPEFIYQYNKFRFSDSLLEQIKSLDLKDLELNLNKLMDNNGNIITKRSDDLFIEKTNPSTIDKQLHVISKTISADRNTIIKESKKHIGIPYSYGDESPTNGFDCSGFTWYIYKKSINYNLPRSSRQQFFSGGGNYVNLNQLKPGDLMFFTSSGRQVSHVTIFLGENKFIHAPRRGRRISVETLNRYWKQKFVKGKTYIQ